MSSLQRISFHPWRSSALVVVSRVFYFFIFSTRSSNHPGAHIASINQSYVRSFKRSDPGVCHD